jgi:hypothetical protein
VRRSSSFIDPARFVALARLVALTLLPVTVAACGETGAPLAADGGTPPPADGVSFSKEVFPLVQASGCGSVTCHFDKRSPTTHFTDYTTAASTYDAWLRGGSFDHCPADGSNTGIPIPPVGAGRVTPGDPDGSLLVKKLVEPRDTCGVFHGRMPPPPWPRVAAADVELIRSWIRQGARDN